MERHPGCNVVGVDPSRGMRDSCERRFQGLPNVEIHEGYGLNIPLPGNSFEYLMSNLALHHVPPDHKANCAGEMVRVLKPGGRLIHADVFSGVPGPPEDPERTRDIIERIVAKALYSLEHGAYGLMLGELNSLPRILMEDGEHLATTGEWAEVLKAAGFGSFEVIDRPPVGLIKIVCGRLEG